MENHLIFRNDDVNINSDPVGMDEIYKTIQSIFPHAEIWSCVTVFGKKNETGSIYPNPPFRHQSFDSFMKVDGMWDGYKPPAGIKVVSHGLWHIDHSKTNYELQKASILTSCGLLNSDRFVPPFNAWNKETEEICISNDIELIKHEDGWKSLEHNVFHPGHRKWYFHGWRFTAKSIQETLGESQRVLTEF